jgi:ribosome-binding factor A
MRTSSGRSQRQLRVGETIRHALAEILQHGAIADPELSATTVTVLEVTMSPDLRLATAYVMPLGGANREAVLAALERNRRFLRGALARQISLKFMPDLRFRLDTSLDHAERIDALLKRPDVARDLGRDEPD